MDPAPVNVTGVLVSLEGGEGGGEGGETQGVDAHGLHGAGHGPDQGAHHHHHHHHHNHHHNHHHYSNEGTPGIPGHGLDNMQQPMAVASVLNDGVTVAMEGGDAHRVDDSKPHDTGVKADDTPALQGDGSAEQQRKQDRRFGKRSEGAKNTISQGMRSKAQNRKQKDSNISLGDRLSIAQKLENREITCREAKELLGCCKSYISQMMKPSNLAKLKKKAELGLSYKLTKAHLPKFPQLEEELNRWADSMKRSAPNSTVPVSMSLMQEKALELATNMNLPDFKASNSWFSNFVKRYGHDRQGINAVNDKRIRVGRGVGDLPQDNDMQDNMGHAAQIMGQHGMGHLQVIGHMHGMGHLTGNMI